MLKQLSIFNVFFLTAFSCKAKDAINTFWSITLIGFAFQKAVQKTIKFM